MKRLAIQLFGHMRTFAVTFPYFYKNLLQICEEDAYIIDIFIHTWNQLDHNTANHRGCENQTIQSLDSAIEEKIKQLYRPKAILIEPQQAIDEYLITEKIGHGKMSIKGCYNVSYSVYKGSELRRKYAAEHHIEYDWVIVTRPDALFLKPFSVDHFLAFYSKFEIEIPKNGLFYAYTPFRNSCCNVEDPRIIAGSDIIYFARPGIIDTATSLFENFRENIDVNNFYCCEVWWHSFFRKKGIEPYPINYTAERDWTRFSKGTQFDLRKYDKNYWAKKIYLFGIPFFTLKKTGDKIRLRFCGIPLLKIKEKK